MDILLIYYLGGMTLACICALWFVVMLGQDLKQMKDLNKSFKEFENEQKNRRNERSREKKL
jgi:hypothetical protein